MKLLRTLLASAALLLATGMAQAAQPARVIPAVQDMTAANGTLALPRTLTIACPQELEGEGTLLAQYLHDDFGIRAAVGKGNAAISLSLDPGLSFPQEHGYTLRVSGTDVRIAAKDATGVFYGIQTLRQLVTAEADGRCTVPRVSITDYPAYRWRAFMHDDARSFKGKDIVLGLLDEMARLKLNVFHWHLTDDQGWRIEIKRYPRLTEVGSTRQRTVIGKNSGEYDNTPYGGFYTQDEAREIVEYARERYIDVIPEVDLPGHMLAALAAYPELGCTGGPYEVCPEWGIFDDVLCMGNDKTFEFLEGVMEEIVDIFPSHYIHIGGDECPRTRWEACPKCQARIRQLGLKADKEHSAEDRLQSYCMARIERFLNERGRQIIGWDEILDGDVAPNATVMSWRGMEGGIKAAKLGHDVIMVPTSYAYLDYYQSKDTENEPFGIGGYVPVEKVYSLEPVPAELTPEEAKHILGAQANLWTEYILTPEHAEYMILPRMAALSEVQWTQPDKKNYADFIQRLTRLAKLYDRMGLNYAKHVFQPAQEPQAEAN